MSLISLRPCHDFVLCSRNFTGLDPPPEHSVPAECGLVPRGARTSLSRAHGPHQVLIRARNKIDHCKARQ